VLLDPDAREAVDRARAVVDALVANNIKFLRHHDGASASSATCHIVGEQVRELQ